MCEMNQQLLPAGGALLRLDPGVGSFIIAGMHIDDIEILNQLMQPLGINPKYFTFADENEEAALKEVAAGLLFATKEKDFDKLHNLREYQSRLWDYVYNERGDVAFWQNWIKKLQKGLVREAGASHLYRGESDADPMHPELECWIDWCEKYEAILENSNVILPKE
jgi:hypothetical protein